MPFEKYAAGGAGRSRSPSSAARALSAGAPNIERVDRLVQAIAAQRGMRNAAVDETVALVDALAGAQPQEGGLAGQLARASGGRGIGRTDS